MLFTMYYSFKWDLTESTRDCAFNNTAHTAEEHSQALKYKSIYYCCVRRASNTFCLTATSIVPKVSGHDLGG